ncbi:MAG TPA: NAD(P)/FAD-dependent oxidoreductase [Bacillota bacterium]|nr:NAD(P)/FAD-dependent oxidoreductase [Bacillota bacterium]
MGRVIVIGAGPAGMMAAIFAARAGARVLLLEKNQEAGKKLLLTGGGRCNLTNTKAGEDLPAQYPGGGRFLHSCLARYGPRFICQFFQDIGVELVTEEEGRVFPKSLRAASVRDALLRELKSLGAEIRYCQPVRKLRLAGGKVAGVASDSFYPGQHVILATGGASFPATGSTGDGYSLAQRAGHTLVPPKAALTPLIIEESWPRSLSGLSVFAQGQIQAGRRKLKSQGQLLFTHFGLSGPLALNLSRYLEKGAAVELNFLPGLRGEELLQVGSTAAQSLDRFLPRRLARQLLELAEIPPQTKNLNRAEKERLEKVLFAAKLTVAGTKPLEEAMVTAGGVALDEVNPKTMASKKKAGLYFAGELLDIDGITGGYNLTIAFATGCAAGSAAGSAAAGEVLYG